MTNLKNIFYDPFHVIADPENLLFWGCLHYHHDPKWPTPLWKSRGHNSVIEHDATIIKNWNSKANEETIGFLLGDTLFGQNALEEGKKLINQLRFRKLFICAGNHHGAFKQLLDQAKINEQGAPVYELHSGKTLYFLPNYFEAFVNRQPVVFSHFPILSWNGQSKGSIHLFSHVHGSLGKSELGKLYLDKTRAVEVSVEKNKYPLNFYDVLDNVRDKKPYAPDHHTQNDKNPF